MTELWEKGDGPLGSFAPLMGAWIAEADSPMGPVRCTRTFEWVLDRNFVRLTARWYFGGDDEAKAYEELALFGHVDGRIRFWSFTSDGQRSEGEIADATDLHSEAFAFEAEMPAGRARMVYWPLEDGAVQWVAEAMTKEGWSRMADHTYRAV